MRPEPPEDINTYVDAAAEILALPLDDERRERVSATLARIAAFAADLAQLTLRNDDEITGAE